MHELTELIKVQFREFFREPGILFWAMGFPVLMAWGLGIAFTQKDDLVRHIAMIKGSSEHGDVNRLLGTSDSSDGVYRLILGDERLGRTVYHLHHVNQKDAMKMIKRGQAALVIHGKRDSVHYRFDPRNPEAQLTYMQLSGAIDGHREQDRLDKGSVIQPFEQTGTRYVDFLVPGLLAMSIMMSAMWGISYSLIDKRSKKLLRRMAATPMRKVNFLSSHLISRIMLSVVESALLLTFTWIYFDILIEGSPLALVLLFLAGNFAFVGIAIFVSSKTANTQVGNGLINLVVMPMMIGSGIFFSYHNFPEWLIPVIQALPLTMLADGVRSIFIEGAGLQDVSGKILMLSAVGTVFFLSGMKIYKWY